MPKDHSGEASYKDGFTFYQTMGLTEFQQFMMKQTPPNPWLQQLLFVIEKDKNTNKVVAFTVKLPKSSTHSAAFLERMADEPAQSALVFCGDEDGYAADIDEPPELA